MKDIISMASDAIVSPFHVTETREIPPVTSTQKADLVDLIQDLQFAQGENFNLFGPTCTWNHLQRKRIFEYSAVSNKT